MIKNCKGEDPYKIIKLLEDVEEPRVPRCQKHPLISILFISIVGALCGADDWVHIEAMGNALQDWIVKFVPLPNGIPSHDTFGRVFSLIKPESFNSFLQSWATFLREHLDKEIINFDGKTLRGTAERGLGLQGIHILNAWSVENGISLGQLKVEDKSNEITAMPELIKLLELRGCVITTDALNTQREIAKAVVNGGADYVLPVKGNQPDLKNEIEDLFKSAENRGFCGIDADHFETIDKDHGRIEKRTYSVIDADELSMKKKWLGIKSIGRVIRERIIGSKTESETIYYVMSIEADAKLFEKCSRGHWRIENSLHWCLDVVFREDGNRYRNRAGAQNLSAIRKAVLALLKQDKSVKGGLRVKRSIASANPSYRLSLLRKFL